jgi:hypothetical protein
LELPTEKRGASFDVGAESGAIGVTAMCEPRGDVSGPLTTISPPAGCETSSGCNGCNGRSFVCASGGGSDCLGVLAPGGGASSLGAAPASIVAAQR